MASKVEQGPETQGEQSEHGMLASAEGLHGMGSQPDSRPAKKPRLMTEDDIDDVRCLPWTDGVLAMQKRRARIGSPSRVSVTEPLETLGLIRLKLPVEKPDKLKKIILQDGGLVTFIFSDADAR